MVWSAVTFGQDLDSSFENGKIVGWMNDIICQLEICNSFYEVKQKVRQMIDDHHTDGKNSDDEKENLMRSNGNGSGNRNGIESKQDILKLIGRLSSDYFTMGLKCCIIYDYGSIESSQLCVFFCYEDFARSWVNEQFRGIQKKDCPRAQVICDESTYRFIQAGAEYRQEKKIGMGV